MGAAAGERRRYGAGAADLRPHRIEEGAQVLDVRLSGSRPMFRLIERMMNLRSRMTGIATGDQGVFVHRDLFRAVGGFPNIPLMEDIEISKGLRRLSAPACLGTRLVTSSRRWEQDGITRTVLLMWRLRLAYYLGASPETLAERYRGG